MRSWLNSPAVVLIGLMGSIITIAQCGVSLVRLVNRLTEDDAKQRVAYIWMTRLSLMAVAVLSGLSWPAVHVVATQNGYPGWQGAVYPGVMVGVNMSADLIILLRLTPECRLIWHPFILLLLGSALQAAALYWHGGPEWCLYLAAPMIALVVLPVVVFAFNRGKRLALRLSSHSRAVTASHH